MCHVVFWNFREAAHQIGHIESQASFHLLFSSSHTENSVNTTIFTITEYVNHWLDPDFWVEGHLFPPFPPYCSPFCPPKLLRRDGVWEIAVDGGMHNEEEAWMCQWLDSCSFSPPAVFCTPSCAILKVSITLTSSFLGWVRKERGTKTP